MPTSRLLIVIAVVAACHRQGNSPAGSTTEPSAEASALLAAVPDDAYAVVRIDPKLAPWDVLTHGFVVPLPADEQRALDQELRELLVARIGLDPSNVRAAVGFARGTPPTAAALIKTVRGKLAHATDDQGLAVIVLQDSPRIVLAQRDDVLAVGEESAVRAAFDVLGGKKPSFTKSKNDLAPFFQAEARGAPFALAARVPDGMPMPPQLAGIKRATAQFASGGVRIAVDGDQAALTRLRDMLSQGVDQAIAKVEAEKQAGMASGVDTASAVGLVVTSHYVRSLRGILPKLQGNQLVADVHVEVGEGAAIAIPTIGILAAVAIPAFMDYMKKSKKTEASLQLNKLAKMMKMLYATNGKLPVGRAPLTPAADCCATGGKCFDARAWATPVWQELDFEIAEPHLFRYSFESDGTTATARAVGDLDCDGTTVTYTLQVQVANGNVTATITEPPPNSD